METEAVETVAEVVTEVALDPETRGPALLLCVIAAAKVVSWWLCGYDFHAWVDWEYDDGTLTTECDVCGAVMEPPR